ncbi:MAG TPA: hypothetical protein VF790_06015 [Dissulfurispiraceae bacterium]
MEEHFRQRPYPAPLLFLATSETEIAGTLFAVYGVLLAPIGWKYALIGWIYALAWFIIIDFIKIGLYRRIRRGKGLLTRAS